MSAKQNTSDENHEPAYKQCFSLEASAAREYDIEYDSYSPVSPASPDAVVLNRETRTNWGTSPEARRIFKVDIGLIDGRPQHTKQRSRDLADASRARAILSGLPLNEAQKDSIVSRVIGADSLNGFNAHYDGFDGAVCGCALVEDDFVTVEDISDFISCDPEALVDYTRRSLFNEGER